MTTLAETYLRLDVVPETIATPDELASLLRAAAERHLAEYFPHADLIIRAEEGSVKGWATVVGGAFFVLVTGYGSLRAGIDYIVKDAHAFDQAVVDSILAERGVEQGDLLRYERRLGTPGRILRLLNALEKEDKKALAAEQERYWRRIRLIFAALDYEQDRALVAHELAKLRLDWVGQTPSSRVDPIERQIDVFVASLKPPTLVDLAWNEVLEVLDRVSEHHEVPQVPTLPGARVMLTTRLSIREEVLKAREEQRVLEMAIQSAQRRDAGAG